LRHPSDQRDPRAELPGVDASGTITPAELQLAARNHGLPLEALAYDVTPAGMHYLLTHYDMPVVDPASWRLNVGGLVGRELSLSLDDLGERPAVTQAVTLECAGNGRTGMSPRPVGQPWLLEAVGTAEWTGVPLRAVLEEAGVEDAAIGVLFGGLDRGTEEGRPTSFERSLSLADAHRDEVLLAYAMNGQPLPPQHGFPLRLVVPGWYGMASVKWLERIALIDHAFKGYHQVRGYCLRQTPDEEGEPLTRMRPRSLMTPPGIPESTFRERRLEPGPVTVRGRAWSGLAEIARVEVSADGGERWSDARLAPATSPWVWQAWEWEWDAQPGAHELCCRATDGAGTTQPLEPSWNLGGYVNNEVQRVPVIVGRSQLDV
jgi:DMSO/TMAO reductase YedYZ molybdopterin-dependent catalytic subunit